MRFSFLSSLFFAHPCIIRVRLLTRSGKITKEVDARDALAANFVAKCDSDPAAYVAVGDLQACLNYLNAIGSRDCTVPGDLRKIRYCIAGQADVNGLSITGVVQTTRWYVSCFLSSAIFLGANVFYANVL